MNTHSPEQEVRLVGAGEHDVINDVGRNGSSGDGGAEARPDICWRILVVDDDRDVHEVTDFVLARVKILGRPLQLLHAFSAREAFAMMGRIPDIAVILLDVVMESEHAGLRLVEQIRHSGYLEPRIILRTGYAGQAPEHEVIRDYDINDYRTKDELSRTRLVSSLTTAIRSYDYIRTLGATRAGLEKVIEGTQQLYGTSSIDLFAEGVLTQIVALVGLEPEGAICALGSPDDGSPRRLTVLSGLGRFSGRVGQELGLIENVDMALVERAPIGQLVPVVTDNRIVLRFRTDQARELLVYFEHSGRISDPCLTLLRVFAGNLAVCFQNQALIGRLEELAFFDQRLGIPNQNAYMRRLGRVIEDTEGQQSVALIALEDAPQMAVAFGVSFTEATISAVYQRIRESASDTVLIARTDEFSLAIIDQRDGIDAEGLRRVFERPFDVNGNPITLKASIGIVMWDGSFRTAMQLDRAARTTLLKATQDHAGGTEIFDPQLRATIEESVRLRTALHRVMREGGMNFAFQPKIAVGSGKAVGGEILARWTLDGEAISPAKFIPIADRAGLTADITHAAIEHVSGLAYERAMRGLDPVSFSVNLSLSDMGNLDFVQSLLQHCTNLRLTPDLVEFEITESTAMEGGRAAITAMHMIKKGGFRLLLDDFGTGFSSLSYLDQMPIDCIKIDRSFVKTLTIDTARRSIAASAQAIAENLGLEVIAEGVETVEQHQLLRFLGVNSAQGFLYGKPMPVDQFLEWEKTWNIEQVLTK